MNYEEIIDGLQIESVIKLMESLGVDRYEEKENCIIFPTICHNINADEASMKLYFYRNNKLFVCYTECGNMSLFKFLKLFYVFYETFKSFNTFNDIFLRNRIRKSNKIIITNRNTRY